jgi:hypothetical protein
MSRRWGALVLVAQVALAAPPGLPDKKLSFDYHQIRVSNLFRVLSEAAGVAVVVDPCAASRSVDLRLTDVPLPLVFDALASRLQLTYVRVGEIIQVECSSSTVVLSLPARASPRVSVDAKAMSVSALVQGVAAQVGARRVEGSGSLDRKVTLHLEQVSLETLSIVLRDTVGVSLVLEGGTLVVSDAMHARAEPTRAETPAPDRLATAKDLYLRGYQLKVSNPEDALGLFREVMRMTDPSEDYHQKAKARIEELKQR